MEAAFPFAAFEREQTLAAAIEIAEPFGIFGVGKVRPDIIVNALEPFEAARVAREAIAFNHRDERFDVYPPKFLVPLELLQGTAEAVHKVEDAAILLIPTVFGFLEGDVLGAFYEFGAAEALAYTDVGFN